jgi:hypothetical protein
MNIKTGKLIKNVNVIEVESTDRNFTIYSSIIDCAKPLGVSRSTIYKKIKTGDYLEETNIVKIRRQSALFFVKLSLFYRKVTANTR